MLLNAWLNGVRIVSSPYRCIWNYTYLRYRGLNKYSTDSYDQHITNAGHCSDGNSTGKNSENLFSKFIFFSKICKKNSNFPSNKTIIGQVENFFRKIKILRKIFMLFSQKKIPSRWYSMDCLQDI